MGRIAEKEVWIQVGRPMIQVDEGDTIFLHHVPQLPGPLCGKQVPSTAFTNSIYSREPSLAQVFTGRVVCLYASSGIQYPVSSPCATMGVQKCVLM